MIKFILNDRSIETDLPKGLTVLDFVRYRQNLKGTKIGCREGDCGACTILVGELNGDSVKYRTQTSCLMPLANAAGKHVVTVEGINRPNGELTEVQQAMVDESGTQCGFCTVGFVMSLTNFCIDETPKTCESAISAIDGNICRCTGYKSIERAAGLLSEQFAVSGEQLAVNGEQLAVRSDPESPIEYATQSEIVPAYFSKIKDRLRTLEETKKSLLLTTDGSLLTANRSLFLAGGTDLYVQKHEEMVESDSENLFDNSELRFISESDEFVEIGASTVVTDLLESPIFNRLFPNLYKHLKLVSSTPIRNMATIAGNFVNASPIGDMTAWFMALNAEIFVRTASDSDRVIPLRDFYLGYKTLSKSENEIITTIRFRKDFTHFNFEKVSKRTYLDISSVNTAISINAKPPASADDGTIISEAHISAGGVAPIPLYLRETSEFLCGKEINETTISEANEIIQSEISPISDVRGSAEYKRLLLRQLFTAHFVELFDI